MTAPHTHMYTIHRWPPNFISYVQYDRQRQCAFVCTLARRWRCCSLLDGWVLKNIYTKHQKSALTKPFCGPQAKATFTTDVTSTASSFTTFQLGLVFRLKAMRDETSNVVHFSPHKLKQQRKDCMNQFFIRRSCRSLGLSWPFFKQIKLQRIIVLSLEALLSFTKTSIH